MAFQNKNLKKKKKIKQEQKGNDTTIQENINWKNTSTERIDQKNNFLYDKYFIKNQNCSKLKCFKSNGREPIYSKKGVCVCVFAEITLWKSWKWNSLETTRKSRTH